MPYHTLSMSLDTGAVMPVNGRIAVVVSEGPFCPFGGRSDGMMHSLVTSEFCNYPL